MFCSGFILRHWFLPDISANIWSTEMSLNQSVKPYRLRGCCPIVQLASVSQRRDDLKHKASINIKVHRPHRAAKERTVNLGALPQTALGPSHTNAHAPWCRVFNEIISRSPFLNHGSSGRAFLQNVYMLRCGCQSNTWWWNSSIWLFACLFASP